MSTGAGTLAGAALVAVTSLLAPSRQDPAPRPPAAQPGAPTCVVCHPGALDGLRVSVHAALLARAELPDRACVACHGEAATHVASARRPEAELVRPEPVAAATCRACHAEESWDASLAAHRWVRSEAIARSELIGEPAVAPPVLPEPEGVASFDWSGLLAVGYRAVSRTGSADRFATDVNLEPGLRLVEGRVTGAGNTALLDRIDLRARDVGDPWTRYSAELEKRGLYRATAGREERVFVYRASGDYGRVERDQRSTTFGLDLELSDDVGIYGDIGRVHDDGFWLTQRIAGRSPPGISVSGVPSPRRIESDEVAVGLRGVFAETRFRVGFEYLEERTDDRWSFRRPAPANPQFDESEDFRSVSDLEGPGLVVALDRSFGDLDLDLDLRHRELDRTVDGGGLRTGFDTNEFVTTTTAHADGDARTTWLGVGAEVRASDAVTFLLGLDWRDHAEHMDLSQTEVTRFPSTGGSVTVVDDRVQRTTQRRLSGTVEVEVEVVDGLVLGGGWGFSREELALPDLVPGDADPTGGTIRDDGAILGAEWRPDERWTVRARYTEYGQSGLALHEQQEDEARTLDTSVRYREDDWTAEVFLRHRRARNDASAYRSARDSYGATFTLAADEGVDVLGSYVFSDVDSRTLTSFYFDPDPTPVPTVVGFVGRTHVATVGLDLAPSEPWRWRNDLAWTDTDGSFDVSTLQWRSELTWQALERGRLGLRYDRIDYAEAGGRDDFHADLVMLYWSQTFGGRGR